MELGLYQHYKGKFYDVVDIAKHADTQEETIVYCAMHGKFETWVNSKKEFEKMIDVDGNKAPLNLQEPMSRSLSAKEISLVNVS